MRKLGQKIHKEEGTFTAYACQYNCNACYCSCSDANYSPYGSNKATGRQRAIFATSAKLNSDMAVIILLS